MSPAAAHRTEIGTEPAAQLVSASCTCGWTEVIGYARPTGLPVAKRLARIKAHAHERDPAAGAAETPD